MEVLERVRVMKPVSNDGNLISIAKAIVNQLESIDAVVARDQVSYSDGWGLKVALLKASLSALSPVEVLRICSDNRTAVRGTRHRLESVSKNAVANFDGCYSELTRIGSSL